MKTTFAILLLSTLSFGIITSSCQKQTDYSTRIDALQARIDSLAAALATTNANLQATNNNVNGLIGSVTAIQTQLSVIVGQISTLNTQLTTINSTVSGLSSSVSSIQSQITVIVGQVATLNTQMTTSNNAIGVLSISITTIQSQLSVVVNQVAILNTQQADTTASLANINAQLSDSITQLNNLLLQFNALLTQLGIVIDLDGNAYQTLTIGTQVWMAENLKTTKYSDGTPILNVTDNAAWNTSSTGAWCYFNNTATNNTVYGKLYNWYAISNPRNLAPTGWHIPSDNEWKILERNLGMTQLVVDNEGYRGANEGSKIAGTTSLWVQGVLTTNLEFGISRFNGLPAGFRYISGSFGFLGSGAFWWTTTTSGTGIVVRNIDSDHNGILRYVDLKNGGRSVRCIKN